ncbi:GNAT family N-acetyltransferase [Marinobacterium mangrovicola]|uniref:Ribosomal protein S18 acetylase RimI-like enzyme n=1 Tax=Marinobacterium mangrovicola TaxID=1476959 RepID=A0A4R1GLD2_9GAMM|nr:GNAT family N-acetyltransferase [Marinobacterium mangrovicola]TCK09347.1 ribosomal protein S18 acetylase RimI-like enzyme [Marinobacterium mangrovicola]
MQRVRSSGIEIQPARDTDRAALAQLFDQYRQFYGYPADRDKAERFIGARLAAGDSSLFVARKGAEICGFVQCYPGFASLECRPSWLLSDLYVVQEARGLGAGRALLRHVREVAAAEECCLVELFTARSNRVAQRLYKSEGYQEDCEFLHYELTL